MVSTGGKDEEKDTQGVKKVLRFEFVISQLDVILRNQRSGFLKVSLSGYFSNTLVFDGED